MRAMQIALMALVAVAANSLAEDTKRGEEVVEKILGQCHCGHVKYEATGPSTKSSYCDCRGCQKATGTLKAPFVTFPRSNVKVIAGELSEFTAEGGEKCDRHGLWQFCAKCGTQVFWKGHQGKEIDVFAGTLDDTSVFQLKK